MYPNAFDYHKASSVQEALSLLSQNPDAKLLAGGHSLIPALKLRLASPSALIDLSGVAALQGISDAGDHYVVGAMTTHRAIEHSDLPLLSAVATLIGDPMVRNVGTIGGSVSHADPAADYPAALIALGASFKIASGSGERVVSADNFFTGMFETAVKAGEMLTEIHIPKNVASSAYEKFAHPASRFAIVGVAVVKRTDGSLSAAFTGAADHAQRLSALESGSRSGLVQSSALLGDAFASAEYRANLVDVLANRALSKL